VGGVSRSTRPAEKSRVPGESGSSSPDNDVAQYRGCGMLNVARRGEQDEPPGLAQPAKLANDIGPRKQGEFRLVAPGELRKARRVVGVPPA
jgi:hypothetical protein